MILHIVLNYDGHTYIYYLLNFISSTISYLSPYHCLIYDIKMIKKKKKKNVPKQGSPKILGGFGHILV